MNKIALQIVSVWMIGQETLRSFLVLLLFLSDMTEMTDLLIVKNRIVSLFAFPLCELTFTR